MESIEELNPHKFKTNETIEKNLKILFERVLDLQKAYGKPFTIASGLRDGFLQQKLINEGKTNAKHSNHLAGAAADILDTDGELAEYLKNNLDVAKNCGLWMEDFNHTKGWVHVQMLPPKSGKRVFIP